MATTSNVDEATKLQAKVLADCGASTSVALGHVGYQLGLYKALAELGECEPKQLAERTGTIERYVREWLMNQAAAQFVSYNAEAKKFYLNAAQKEVLTDESSPRYCAMDLTLTSGILHAALRDSVTEMRTGHGVSFSAHDRCYIESLAVHSQATYRDRLVQLWIAACASEAQNAQLRDEGAAPLVICDVGCGYSAAIRLMAQAYMKQHVFIGLDVDDGSVEMSRSLTAKQGLTNCLFDKCDAHHVKGPKDVAGFEQLWKARSDAPCKTKYDIIICLSTLHDLQDPLAALVVIREHLEPVNGVLMVVEPIVREQTEANFNTRGQFLTAASITWCTPGANLPRSDGAPKTSTNLGTFGADSLYAEMATQAGFSRFKKLPSDTDRLFAYQI